MPTPFFAEYLVSPNVGRTLTASRQSVADARGAADWLFERGYERVGLIGTSIGSCMAFLTFAHDPRFSVGVFIHVSTCYADVVWEGLSTSHVRRALERAISLDRLRHLWAPISPFPYVSRLRNTDRPMMMISGRYDLTFPPDLTQRGHQEFLRHDVPVRQEWLPCGHHTMGKSPFRWVEDSQFPHSSPSVRRRQAVLRRCFSGAARGSTT